MAKFTGLLRLVAATDLRPSKHVIVKTPGGHKITTLLAPHIHGAWELKDGSGAFSVNMLEFVVDFEGQSMSVKNKQWVPILRDYAGSYLVDFEVIERDSIRYARIIGKSRRYSLEQIQKAYKLGYYDAKSGTASRNEEDLLKDL